MGNYKKLTEIDPEQKYEGYLWWSDAASPEVYQNQQLPQWHEEKSNPFIIEGQLYDKSNNKSYSIRFVDGEYIIRKYDLEKMELEKQEKKCETIVKKYLPNRFPESIHKLLFKEFWRPVNDKLCGSKIGKENDKNFEGMEVLQPAETVFVGFNFKED
jgi:CRISPR type III-associated protein (TIGR04423 family)